MIYVQRLPPGPVYPPPSTRALIIGVIVVVAAIVTLVGCGPSARQAALTTELVALNTARDTFVSWDRDHQSAIVDQALADGLTKAAVTALIDAYRATVQTAVMRAFAYAYERLAAAALDEKKPLPKAPAALIQGVRDLKPGHDPPAGFPAVP